LRRTILVAMVSAVVAVAMVATAPTAFGQEPVQAKITDDVQSNAWPGGKAEAKAGGSISKAEPCPAGADAKSGDVEAKAPCVPKKIPPPPPAPAPKAAPAPAPPPAPAPAPKAAPPMPPPPPKAEAKELPKTGGAGSASLLGLGAGALLVGGGLIARRFLR
jgi:LPXTG-motif cell wall-anchored protein